MKLLKNLAKRLLKPLVLKWFPWQITTRENQTYIAYVFVKKGKIRQWRKYNKATGERLNVENNWNPNFSFQNKYTHTPA